MASTNVTMAVSLRRLTPPVFTAGFAMFQRISTGWQLTQQSFNVLRLDKELLVFPLLSGIACALVMATFAVPIVATGFLESVADEDAAGGKAAQILGYVVLFAYYVVNYFVIIFFN